jgi:uncharacterized protein
MKSLLLVLAFAVLPVVASATVPVSRGGIPLDAPWKVKIARLVETRFVHPAWGWQHAERNYLMAMRLAKGDGLRVDTDVLFAACMLHDMAAFPPYRGKGEHGDVAAVKSEAVLRDAGFPMQKYPQAAAAMRGHMYYSNPGKETEAILLHDADSLDFLGAIGEARILALAGQKSASVTAQIAMLRSSVKDIPPRLVTKTAKKIGAERARELTAFLEEYRVESYGGKLP